MKLHMHYCTYIPVLIKCVQYTEGDVLELGTGIYSTALLHFLCSPYRRRLVSYESDPGYFSKFGIPSYADQYHSVYLIDDWDKIPIDRAWDVVLVDHAPSERRRVDALRLAQLAKYIILHDTDGRLEKHYHYSEIYPYFKYRYDFQLTRPYTTVVSNFIDLSEFSI